MQFKVKRIPISSGNKKFVVIHKEDSEKYDIHRQTRIRIKHGNHELICIAETTYADKLVKPGQIGIFSEVQDILKLKRGSKIHAELAQKPASIAFIKKKLSGKTLNKKEIHTIIRDIVHGEVSDIELTYFVAGCYSNELTDNEVHHLITAIVGYGKQLTHHKKPIMDKHCIGGIPGNRTTMLVVPIIAAAGLTIPKTSSRSITSPAGTADTMEVLTNVSLDLSAMKKTIRHTNGCLVWGGAMALAPADDEIIHVEYPLFIDTIGLLLSSVLAKKYSVGATHVLIDIPYGEEAKVKTIQRAKKLKARFEAQARKLGMKMKVVLTDGSQPIGFGVGPLLEVHDVLKVLKNDPDAPKDLREKSLYLATELLKLSGKFKQPAKVAKDLLDSGKAYMKFMEIIDAQGRKVIPPLATHRETMMSPKNGKISKISNKGIAKISRLLGAPKTVEAGVYLHKKLGDRVQKGEGIITLYAKSKTHLKYAIEQFEEIKPIKVK